MLVGRVIEWDEKENGHFSEDLFRFHMVKEGFRPSESVISDPGDHYTPHNHPYDEWICVVRGCLDVLIYGERYRISPGKRLFVKAYEVHEALAVGSVPVESFDAVRYN